MNDIANDRVGPMPNPLQLDEPARENIYARCWRVIGMARRSDCESLIFSRLLNGKAANMVLALKCIGWGTIDHWMRMLESYGSTQSCRNWIVAKRRTGEILA